MGRFDSARRAALMRDLVDRLSGRSSDLLSFHEVQQRLHLRSLVDRGIREIPLDQIVGSLGRPREFNRAFLPRREASRERWKDVEKLTEGQAGFPPIEVYKVADTYFVIDGHHRVSVVRSLGAPTIEAHVKEFETPVHLGPGASAEEVVLKGGLVEFLEAAGLEPSEDDEFLATVCNGYERLLDHISVHRWFLGLERDDEIGWSEAVASWHERVYAPVIERIRESGVLEEFPDRTPTDLYLFTMDHLHRLRERYAGEREVQAREAVEELGAQGGRRGLLERTLGLDRPADEGAEPEGGRESGGEGGTA